MINGRRVGYRRTLRSIVSQPFQCQFPQGLKLLTSITLPKRTTSSLSSSPSGSSESQRLRPNTSYINQPRYSSPSTTSTSPLHRIVNDTPSSSVSPTLSTPFSLSFTGMAISVPVSEASSSTMALHSAAELTTTAPQQEEYLLAKVLPVGAAEDALIALHDVTGLPWWASLALGAACVRALVFPLNFLQLREAARISRMSLYFSAIKGAFKVITTPKNKEWQTPSSPPEVISRTLGVARYLLKPVGFRVSRMFLPMLASVPAFITFNLAMRRLLLSAPSLSSSSSPPNSIENQPSLTTHHVSDSASTLPSTTSTPTSMAPVSHPLTDPDHAYSLASLHTEGVFWCPDLAQPDPYYILPTIAVGVTVLNIHLAFHRFRPDRPSPLPLGTNSLPMSLKPTSPTMPYVPEVKFPMLDILTTVLTGCVALIAPFTVGLPSGYFIYWIIVMTLSAVQAKISRTPLVRALAGFASPPIPIPTPRLQVPALRRPPGELHLFPALEINKPDDYFPKDLDHIPPFIKHLYSSTQSSPLTNNSTTTPITSHGVSINKPTNGANDNIQR